MCGVSRVRCVRLEEACVQLAGLRATRCTTLGRVAEASLRPASGKTHLRASVRSGTCSFTDGAASSGFEKHVHVLRPGGFVCLHSTMSMTKVWASDTWVPEQIPDAHASGAVQNAPKCNTWARHRPPDPSCTSHFLSRERPTFQLEKQARTPTNHCPAASPPPRAYTRPAAESAVI